MSQFLTSNELFINIKNPPKWNPRKNFFDQPIDVIDFYLEEKKKITEGITIGGYHIHPWLYWHLNFFKTPIPTKEGKEIIMNPPLDDNMLFVMENYKEAEDRGLGLMLFGTRGFTKSSMLASLLTWLNSTKPNGTTSVMGGNDGDLKSISTLLKVGFNNVNPAMFIPQLIQEWDNKVELGIKEKDGFRLPHSHISITNGAAGTDNSSEKGAGLSPVGFILDEALHEDSLIQTPIGLVAIKNLKIGDNVLNENGDSVRIYNKIDPGIQETLRFTFSDGSVLVSSMNHKWKVREIHSTEWVVKTTEEIYESHCKWMFPKYLQKDVRLDYISYAGQHQVYCIGVEHESETFLTQHGIVTKNCGKWAFKKVLQSALPSFKTQYGMKLVPILSGTSGNQDLSKDAKDVLSNPEAYDMLPMNWDTLDRKVDPEFITWERSKKESFCTFVPGQMSYRLPVEKIQTNLASYLGVDNKDLEKIKVNETDWKNASTFIKDKNDSFKKEEDREKNRMYFPLEIADVFITASSNPFPTAIIDKHIRKLEDEGITGKSVNIYKHNGEYKQEFSAKKLAEVSHGGGEADAPILLFGELPETTPPKFAFVSGLDDYKLDQSDTDSLGSFYVLKRRNLEMNSPCETIAASYVARPFRHSDFHKTGETLIEAFNAICMMEAVDVSFKQFLDTKYKSEQLLAPSISFSNSSQNGITKLNSKFGIYPTGGNKAYMFNMLIDYCKEEHVIGIDDDGNEIIKYGVEYIEDLGLLKEMLSYRKGGNFDRITAFMHALAYARELDKNNVRPTEKRKQSEWNTSEGPKKVRLSVFGSSRPTPF